MEKNEFMLTQIARMYYVDKLRQNEIAKRMDMTPMMISRYLRKAEDLGIVSIHIRTPWATDMQLGKQVAEHYRLDECIALESKSEEESSSVVAGYFADYFPTMVRDRYIIGISWGKTISEFALKVPYMNVTGCEVLQLNGGLVTKNQSMMPSAILHNLGQKLNAVTYPMNAPLYVESKEIKELLMDNPTNKIVSDKARIADVAIVGVSPLSWKSTTMTFTKYTESEYEQLEKARCIGDIASIFIDKDGNQVQWCRKDAAMSVSLSTMTRARHVVCLAGEVSKAEVLKACAKKRYFNTLITTKKTAQLMMKD